MNKVLKLRIISGSDVAARASRNPPPQQKWGVGGGMKSRNMNSNKYIIIYKY